MKVKQIQTKTQNYFYVGGELFVGRHIREHMRTNNKTFCFILVNSYGTCLSFFENIENLMECVNVLSNNSTTCLIHLDPVDNELHEIEVEE